MPYYYIKGTCRPFATGWNDSNNHINIFRMLNNKNSSKAPSKRKIQGKATTPKTHSSIYLKNTLSPLTYSSTIA